MGRRPQGYQLRKPRPDAPWSVRFRVDGERFERSTGERDRAAAERTARRLYAEALGGRPGRIASAALGVGVLAAWLDTLPLRPTTRALYEKYSTYWLRARLRPEAAPIAAYVRGRLKEARGKTVRSELSALRSLLRWMVEVGELDALPQLPELPASALGTPSKHAHRVAAPDYTEAEVRKVLRALPDKSPSGIWVRPRCELLWETGLRPSTVDRIEVPRHWSPGSRVLLVTDDVDKEGFSRELPLSPRALAILKRCAPSRGLVFGQHRYEHWVQPVAQRVLGGRKGDAFTSQHLRSARATHLLEKGADLPAVQYLLGHKHASTTARYVRPTFRAAAAALKRVR